MRADGPSFEVQPSPGGAAPPLACFHGFLGQPAMWSPALAGYAGPVALARLPGHGPRPWVRPGAGFVEVVDALAEAMPFDRPAWLLGYSMGARVALALALRHPGRVAGALLVGAQPGLRAAEERAARAAWEDGQRERILTAGLPAFVDEWERLPLFASQAALPAEIRAKQRAARLDHDASAIAWSLEALGLGRMPSMWDDLAGLRVPLRLVSGALDAKFRTIAEEMARVAPDATHVVAPGAGHNVALEAPVLLAAEIRSAAR